jgi:hypothetical protein
MFVRECQESSGMEHGRVKPIDPLRHVPPRLIWHMFVVMHPSPALDIFRAGRLGCGFQMSVIGDFNHAVDTVSEPFSLTTQIEIMRV